MAKDPEQFAHQEWLGYVQPIGLVVSIPALLHAQAHVQRNIAEEHSRFLSCLPRDKQDEVIPEIRDFPEFTRTVLSWEANDLIGAPGGEPLPASLEATLPGYNETLRPTYAVREFQPQDGSRPWMLLIKSLVVGTDLDALSTDSNSHWQASPHSKFERLLRETQVPFGLLVNGTHLRLVYAPRGETSGYATFSVSDMAKVAGRPIFAALHMLLCAERLFSLPEKQRLPAILADSRKYQNVVSTQLAEQVLAALYELVRGFQAADEQRRGELLRDVLAENPNHVYAGLLTVLLRLVFVLFAEDRGLLSSDPVYSNFYSATGLFERLRADAGRYTDTMDQRYGAWAQLLTLFRLIYDGGQHGGLKIPARRGYLFDPDRYNFLEGRQWKAARRHAEKVDVPHIADGVIYRVLEKLLVLDGERLSYRTLDVEQIGSVYETMMGFNLEVAQGRSIAIKPAKPHGAPTSINLDELLTTKPADRVKWIAEKSDQKLTGPAAESLKSAASVEDLLAAMDRKIARHATPNVVPKAAMLLQPSDERRRSGSHYTPRSLTEPIVRTTLRPILEQLGVGRLGEGDGGKQHEQQDQLVSRSQSLAVGHGPSGGVLRSDEAISARGIVRDDQPDSSGVSVDSSKHRGGSRTRLAQGIPAIPANSTSESQGTGNASAALGTSQAFAGSVGNATVENSGPIGTNVASTSEIPRSPTEQGIGKGGVGAGVSPTTHLPNPNSFPRPEQILALKICDPAMGSGAFLVEVCRQLAEALVEAWHFHNCVPMLPPDEDEVLHARRLIAQHCLYGVDKNPMAVDLSKLSLWLATLAKDHPFTFLDHSLRCGDSLVGLSREQIASFTWEQGVGSSGVGAREKIGKSSPKSHTPNPSSLFSDPIDKAVRRATEYRQRILAARDDKPYEQLRQELDVADEALSLARLTGDCVIAAYFSAGKDRERVVKLDTLARQLVQYLGPQRRIEDRQPLTAAVASLHVSDHPLHPFHWQIEFPEVFTVDAKGKPTGGFDAIVGNPPFAGSVLLSESSRDGYPEFLRSFFEGAGGKADLVAYFFRRSFEMLRSLGTFGLISTNSIAQGETRSAGLAWICLHGGQIYSATKRLKWPGLAAVVVSVIHIAKGSTNAQLQLDNRIVPEISAFLFHTGGHNPPTQLGANLQKAFRGSVIWGSGFTFDDSNDSTTTPIAAMHSLINADPRNSECVFPYIGGEELNDSPTQSYRRFVINFGEMNEEQARRWPDLMKIVEAKVRPERERHGGSIAAQWWLFGRRNQDGLRAIAGMKAILAQSQTSSHLSFAFIPSDWVHSHALNVFAFDGYPEFCVLQSRPHECWARFFASSMKDDMRYTPNDCFETFPFPAGVLEHAAGDSPTTDNGPLNTLETVGREYYEFRAALMIRHNEGLTKTYNRFHDPHETSPDILQLRALHAAMDRAVLEAYAWHDLAQTATCEFLLDYEDDEDEDEGSGARSPGTGRQKKKPWRYRWPDPFRDEVLARLLELNKQRAEEERIAGELATDKKKKKSTKSTARGNPKRDDSDQTKFNYET